MADLVESVLRDAAEKQAKFKTTEVEKDIEVEIDEGNLLAVDTNPLTLKELNSQRGEYLRNLVRDNTQLLINKLWQLPVERQDDVVIAKLPDPTTVIPREKPIPKDKPQTRWEKYAKLKGIQNRKKSRMAWDEQKKEYRPRWGYKRAGDDTKDWVIEVPENADPYEDQFEKRMKSKKERVAKNELNRLRNIARAQKTKVPGVGLTPTDTPTKDHVGKALAVAKRSTASIGRFTESLPKEKPSRFTGKKRQFEPNYGNIKSEKLKQLNILNLILNKQPKLDVTKAVNSQMLEEETSRSQAPRKEKQKAGGKRGFKGGRGKFSSGRGGKGGHKGKRGRGK
ncbi:ribosome biogenesis regulatory protein homolog [Liolophura sinensis]|uniref:ribosome biogenesis regulatory protein homolog n=1 Tax=Liolophura sinensis TaxID=3198878 RepID=UPI003158D624